MWRKLVPYVGITAAVAFGVALAPYAGYLALAALGGAVLAFLLGAAWLLLQRVKAWWRGPEVIWEEPARPH